MQKSTYAKQLPTILASINRNGEDTPNKSNPLPEEEPEEFDVYIEPDRITVIKRPEPQAQVIEAVQSPQSQTQPYFTYIAMSVSLLLLCYLVSTAFITTFFPPTVTVTLLTKSQTVKATGIIQLQARAIPPITLIESQTVQTTGRRHQDARSAIGFITLYNGEFQSVTIPAGKTLTGNSGVTVITDQIATIPAANINPPTFGQVTVSAHAINLGQSGNIPSLDINTPCCFASVIAKNPEHFTGGQDERNFQIVTKKDIAGSASSLETNLAQSMRAALQTQQKQGEAFNILPCSPQVTTDHQPGEEAATVHITVSETCQGYAYSQASFFAQAATILSRRAGNELGSGYTRTGTLHVAPTSTRVTKNIVTITFTSQGVYGYVLSKQTQQHIKQLLTGKRKYDAERLLLALPGIQKAVINGIDDLAKLPKDPNAIYILVIIPISS